MKNNIIYFFSILIIEIGLLLQWFTLRRITMIVVYLIGFNLFFLFLDYNQLLTNSWIDYLYSFFYAWFVTEFIEWNFKKEDYEII